jgi:hypothetical protein
VVRHRKETDVDLPFLAAADTIDRRLHVIVDATGRYAAKHTKAVPGGVEEHLMRLQQVSSDQKSSTVRQLDVCDLKLRALAAYHGIIFTPIELECFTWAERQRNEYATANRPLLSPPLTGKRSDPTIGAGKAENHQIRMKLLQRSALLGSVQAGGEMTL